MIIIRFEVQFKICFIYRNLIITNFFFKDKFLGRNGGGDGRGAEGDAFKLEFELFLDFLLSVNLDFLGYLNS